MLEWLFRHVTCEIGQDGRVVHPESFARSLPPTSSREDSETIEASSSALVLVLLEHVLHPKQQQKNKKKEVRRSGAAGLGKVGRSQLQNADRVQWQVGHPRPAAQSFICIQ